MVLKTHSLLAVPLLKHPLGLKIGAKRLSRLAKIIHRECGEIKELFKLNRREIRKILPVSQNWNAVKLNKKTI